MRETPPHDACPQAVLASSYVLGALEPEEAAAYEHHLAGCPICRDELALLQPAADLLAQAVPRVRAPDELRDRVMAQVRAEAELLRTAGPDADRPTRRRVPRRLGALAAAAALGCGVGIGVLVAGGGSPVARTVQAYVAPAAPAGRAELVRAGGPAQLIVSRMPQPARGKIYQVWLARPGLSPQPTDALFSVNRAGNGSVAVPGNLTDVRQVMVTAEPLGGSAHPTSRPIVIVTL